MPRMLRNALLAGFCFVAGWIAYFWMTKIDQPDVYAYHEYTYWTEPRSPLRPGDIVTVGRNGQLLWLCSLDAAETEESRFMTAAYFNGYGAAADALVRLIASVRSAFSGGDEDGPSVASADGRKVVLHAANLEMEEPPRWTRFNGAESCEQAMARALSAPEPRLPCTVQKSLLVKTRDTEGTRNAPPFTYAVRLASYANIPGTQHFEAIHREPVVIEPGHEDKFACPQKTFPRDVRIRHWLRAIQRETAF